MWSFLCRKGLLIWGLTGSTKSEPPTGREPLLGRLTHRFKKKQKKTVQLKILRFGWLIGWNIHQKPVFFLETQLLRSLSSSANETDCWPKDSCGFAPGMSNLQIPTGQRPHFIGVDH